MSDDVVAQAVKAVSSAKTVTPDEETRKLKAKPSSKGTVLVTGVDLFLSAHILSELHADGVTAFPIDKSMGYDIRNEAEVLQALMLSGPSTVIHVASSKALESPGDFFRDILDMGRHLVHGCALKGTKLVLVENLPGPVARSVYDAVGDLACAYRDQTSGRFEFCRVILPDIFGPGKNDLDSKMHQIAEVAIRGASMNVSNWVLPGMGGGEILGLFIQDAAQAVIQAAFVAPSERFEVLAPKWKTEDVVKAALVAAGQDGHFEWNKEPGPWDAPCTPPVPLAKPLPDWKPKTPLAEAMRATVNWMAMRLQESAKAQ